MSSSSSSLSDNLSEGLHNDKCVDCEPCLDYISIKGNQLIFKCLNCNKYYTENFNKELINRLSRTYKLFNREIIKFILLLRKAVYPYEYMDS